MAISDKLTGKHFFFRILDILDWMDRYQKRSWKVTIIYDKWNPDLTQINQCRFSNAEQSTQ